LNIDIKNNLENKGIGLISDWKTYQQILFGVIQNGIKYNIDQGSMNIKIYREKDENE
jgi:hypothetical protein